MVAAVLLATLAQLGPLSGGNAVSGPRGSTVVDRLLQPGTNSVTTIDTDFCTTHADYITGASSFCWEADGSASGLTMTATGTPTDQIDPVCPNGSNCASVTSERFASGSYYTTATSQPTPAGDFSTCALASVDSTSPSYQFITAKGLGTSTTNAMFYLSFNASNIQFYVSNGVGNTNVTSSSGAISGLQHLVCATYDYVADGSSVVRVYLDGTQVATSSAVVGPPGVVSDGYSIAANSAGSFPLVGRVGIAFFTESLLSADDISAMAAAVFPRAVTQKGRELNTPRNTVRSCGEASTLLQASRECVDEQGRLSVWGNHSNLVVRSTELEDAAWTKYAATVAANTTIALDGTKTADRVTEDSTLDYHYVRNTFTPTAGTVYTLSAEVKQGVGTRNLEILTNAVTGNAATIFDLSTGTVVTTVGTGATSSIKAIRDGWYRVALTLTADVSTSSVFDLRLNAGSLTNTTHAGDGTSAIDMRAAQVNTGSVAAPHCPTFGTAPVTCNADAQDLGTELGAMEGSFSVAFDYTHLGESADDYPALLSKRPWSATYDLGWAVSVGGIGSGANKNKIGAHYADGAAGIDATSVWTSPTLVLGQTYRIAVAFVDKTSVELFVDGTSYGTKPATFSGSAKNTANKLSVGWDSPTGTRRAQGAIENICIGKTSGACR